MPASKGKKNTRHLNETYVHQINVLRALVEHSSKDAQILRELASRPRTFDISEIAQLSGLRDEKETQRYLYILEGHKLVSPFPAGDFTSKNWHVTEDGMKAYKSISSEVLN